MDLLLLLTYAAICIGIFKLFRIPVNAITLLTATLGGIFLIGFLVLAMNYNHPYATDARFYFTTTPILPTVSGKVVDVPVQVNTPLKAGDELFRLEDTLYASVVTQKKAALASAEQNVKQLEAALAAANRVVIARKSDRDRAKDAFDRAEKLRAPGSVAGISEANLEQLRGQYLAAEANVGVAESQAEGARLNAESMIGGTHTDVARLRAELQAAEFNLAETVVRAPTDGMVLQLFLRKGMMTVPMPLRPVMVFAPQEKPSFVAAFLQNSAQRIEKDAEAEVILPAVPGRIFKAKVVTILPAIAQGQLQPTGSLIDPDSIRGEGKILVQLEILEDLSAYHLPPGSNGSVAVYSHHMHHVAVMRKVLIRMKSWMNYVFGLAH